MAAVATNQRKWRFYVCDINGATLAEISRKTLNKQMKFRLNKPDELSFDIRSDSPECCTILSDGYPVIAKQRRTVKGYRLEPVAGVMTWVLRGGWIVWQTEDTVTGDDPNTAVTCLSPLVMISKMPVVGATGVVQHVTFDGVALGDVMVTLLSNANSYMGF